MERKGAYQPVLTALNKEFGENRDKIKVLVPGCGLGRLVWECFNNGFDVEGNEFSLYMLIVSAFILNKDRICSFLWGSSFSPVIP